MGIYGGTFTLPGKEIMAVIELFNREPDSFQVLLHCKYMLQVFLRTNGGGWTKWLQAPPYNPQTLKPCVVFIFFMEKKLHLGFC